jgi:hypothetical protein
MNWQPGIAPDVAELVSRAASGDLDAQRTLASASLAEWEAAQARGEQRGVAIAESVLWSRLAASHGDGLDQMRLARALIHAANEFGAQRFEQAAIEVTAQAVAIIRALASAGDDPAIAALQEAIADVPPEVLRRASALLESRNA